MTDLAVIRADIEAASGRLSRYVRATPTIELEVGVLGITSPLALKLEFLQVTGSFKARGAFNLLLSSEVPEAGVVAASGGNFGLAIAHAASVLGHRATVFVPSTSPATKIGTLSAYGADVQVIDGYYDDARAAAEEHQRETGALWAHAYDQPPIVAGAGTVGRELVEQWPGVDTVLVAVGGGGLLGGVATWCGDDVRVVAVETEGTPTLHRALEAGEPVDVEISGTAASSLGARRVGDIGFAAAQRWVERSLLVSDEDVTAAQKAAWDAFRLVLEPGGAVALAALTAGAYVPASDERVAVILCGANTDPADLRD